MYMKWDIVEFKENFQHICFQHELTISHDITALLLWSLRSEGIRDILITRCVKYSRCSKRIFDMSVWNKVSLYREKRDKEKGKKTDGAGRDEETEPTRGKRVGRRSCRERRPEQACGTPAVGADAGVQVVPALPAGGQGEPGRVLQLWPEALQGRMRTAGIMGNESTASSGPLEPDAGPVSDGPPLWSLLGSTEIELL